MRFGAITVVSSVAGALTVLMLVVVLYAVKRLRSDMQVIRKRFDAEQRRREAIYRKLEENPDIPLRRMRLVHRLPPSLLVLSALTLELVKRHPVPSLGLTSAAAGLAASAVLIHPAVPSPAETNPGPRPMPAVHAPVHAPVHGGGPTPVRKEAVPVGTRSPDVPTGPTMSPAAATVSPAPGPTSIRPPQPATPSPAVLPLPLTPAGTPPHLPLPSLTRVCVTVGRVQVCA
jgi:hypothetical protein